MCKGMKFFWISMRTKLTVLMLCFAFGAFAQNSTVKGNVLDETGQPVIGATVKVQGTNINAITDIDGNYSINCPANGTLELSYVGYKTAYVKVGNRSKVDVKMTPEATAIDEVVVTALGIKRQSRSLGYSTTKVGGEDFQLARDPNIGNALSGKIAGVNVAGNGTGSTGTSRVVIRGNASLTGNNMPLYVVDGVPFDNTNQGSAGMWGGSDMGDGLSNINADDIESIQVLKGAAASALYGYRGGNGAILITTKSGKKNQPVSIEVNENLTFNSIYDYRDWQKTFGLGKYGVKPTNVKAAQEGESNSWGAALDGSEATNFLGNTYAYKDVDNWSKFYRTGITTNTSASVSGSAQNITYRFGASYNKEKSILPNAGNRQVGLNMNTTYDIFKNLHLTVTANYTTDKSNGRANLSDGNGNTNASLLYRGNSFDIEWMKGTEKGWGTNLDGSEMIGGTNVYFNNPYWLQYRKTNDMNRTRLVGAVNLRWDITDWLYIQGAVQHDGYNFEYKQVQPVGAAADPAGWMTQYSKNFHENNYNFLLGFNKTFGDWTVGATFGGNKQFDISKIFLVSDGGRPFVVDGLWSVNNLSDKRPAIKTERYQVNSLYGTADLGWKNQVFLNLTARNDWFSTLADNSNSYFYPSATLSWVFTDTFRNQLPAWFDFGKLRAGLASASNGTSPYQNLLLYQLRNYKVNGQIAATQNNGDKYPSNTLKPVHISEFEVGLNLSFFESRLNFDMAYYVKKTTDDIAVVSTSSASGYGSKVANVGKLKNNGFEFMVDAYPIRNKNFQWNTTLNFAYNNSNVEFLGDGVDRLSIDGAQSRNGNVYIYNVVGQPYGQIIGNKYKRDANGNLLLSKGLPQAGEQTILGNGVYKWTGGFRNSFSYKNFTLAFLIDAKFGAKIFSGTNYQLYSYGMHKNTLNGRTADNAKGAIVASGIDEATGKANTVSVSAQDYYQAICKANIGEEFVYSADFIKLRELSLGYTFPKSMFTHMNFVKGLSLSLVARNLWTIMKHTPNIDPESAVNAGNGQGLELNGYPTTRNIGFNVNIKF
ncbi:TonB-dependent receptor plug domain protein [Prevotella sp. DNF00663]|nr:collagen-binding protein [Prevotella sp. S7 MS 2]KXB86018.1 TonB-dependent receptor plug domain protein [Prevotella sp. DNF00663]